MRAVETVLADSTNRAAVDLNALVAAAHQHASGDFVAAIRSELPQPRTVQRLRRILGAWLPPSPETSSWNVREMLDLLAWRVVERPAPGI